MVSAMSPVPFAEQVAPLEATHVHAAPVSDDGSASVTVAPTTSAGPALLATIV
jgi:hypothetical protein